MASCNTVKIKLNNMGKSMGWLARRTNLDRAYITRIVSGKVKSPSVQTALRLADALKCRVEDLWTTESRGFRAIKKK